MPMPPPQPELPERVEFEGAVTKLFDVAPDPTTAFKIGIVTVFLAGIRRGAKIVEGLSVLTDFAEDLQKTTEKLQRSSDA